MKPIIVIGGINMDIKAAPKGSFQLHHSNPAHIIYSPGGVARNIAENLARLGVPVKLMGKVGNDPMAERLLTETKAAGVDVSAVLRSAEHPTGVDINFMDEAGDLHLAYSNMEITDSLSPDELMPFEAEFEKCSYLILDANLSIPTLQYLINLGEKHQIPVVLEPGALSKAARIAQLKGEIFMITPSEAEWEAIYPNALLHWENALITKGENGVEWKSNEGIKLFSALTSQVVDTIGAGDAFVAGVLFGLVQRKSISSSIPCGIAAATITIQCRETVSPLISPKVILDFEI